MPYTVPSLRSIARFALGSAQVGLLPYKTVDAGQPPSCPNPQLSCHNTTAVQDTCCFNAPGGQLLQTQFWDTNPTTGPVDHWTVHGLWPDHCDGTYDANCDPARQYTNISAIIASYGKTDLLDYMNTYWKDYAGNDESFWEHEWGKHGTCISTLDPNCYTGYTEQEEVVDFFQKTVDLFKGLDSYQFLAVAGIYPSTDKTYTSDEIQAALSAPRGHQVTIGCRNGALDEIWYHFDVSGSVQTGEFVPTDPDGTKSTCPATGVKYLPKSGASSPSQTSAPSTTAPSTTLSTTIAPTATQTAPSAPFSGKGYLNVQTGGSQSGCIISAGKWYTTGACATFSAAVTTSGDGFTLKSSKGGCSIVDATLSCDASVTSPTVFTNINESLAVDGSTAFYASNVPTGSTQGPVYTTEHSTSLEIVWQSV
ncbi:MAG: ribonuclease T2-like [Pleopsidium flavum]|nr:MAG: ribonuclease T2-like [Pleopsidium flavum]